MTVRIRFDWSWLPFIGLVVAWLGTNEFDQAGFGNAAAVALVFFGAQLVHELAHIVVGFLVGHRVKDIHSYPFGGIVRHKTETHAPWREAAVGIAGPIASIALGVFLLQSPSVIANLAGWGSVFIGVLNFVPGLPLDGGRVLRAILWRRGLGPYRSAIKASIAGQICALVLIASGLLVALLVRDALWVAFVGTFLYVTASSSRRSARLALSLGGVVAGQRATPFSAWLDGSESVASLKKGHLYGVLEDGRIAGVVGASQMRRATDARQRAIEIMAPYRDGMTVQHDQPYAQALGVVEKFGAAIVVGPTGRAAGVLEQDAQL